MKALNRGLYCLTRPSALIAVALLLVNDHLLKAIFPSWWTGKVSDFAGLYFFPFVVIVLLGLVTDRLEHSPAGTGAAAFLFVGGWFSAMKTIPLANEGTVFLWRQLIGRPVAVVLDPTDLLALAALWPAWHLWRRSTKVAAARIRTISRSDMVLLSVAAAASLASSCPSTPGIYEVFTNDDGAIYAILEDGADTTIYQYELDSNRWEQANIGENSPEEKALPIESCVPNGPCYRVNGDERVWKSEDKGATWQIAWAVPPGRRKVMDRYHTDLCDLLRIGPYDIVTSGSGTRHRAVVASGTEGVLVRHPNGSWKRQAVGPTAPTPYTITSLENISAALTTEFLLLVIGTTMVTSALYAYIWRSIVAFLAGVIAGPLIIAFTIAQPPGFVANGIVEFWFGWLVILTTTVFLAVNWMGNETNVSEARRRSALKWWLLATLAMPVGFIFMVLWLMGTITYYETARNLWVAATMVLAVSGIVRSRQLMQRDGDLLE